jgi:hypothetical protein
MGQQVQAMKYKIEPFDEVHDVWLLYRKSWWLYRFVSAGKKAELEKFVKSKGGELIWEETQD